MLKEYLAAKSKQNSIDQISVKEPTPSIASTRKYPVDGYKTPSPQKQIYYEHQVTPVNRTSPSVRSYVSPIFKIPVQPVEESIQPVFIRPNKINVRILNN